MPTIEPQKSKKIEEGKHKGTIIDVVFKDKPFEYTDYVIELEEGATLKYGVPTPIYIDEKTGAAESQHAILLKTLGFDVTKTINPEEAKGKIIEFSVAKQQNKEGKFFTNIVKGTIRLAE
ncbi:MAG: hypothetical protein GTO02_13585 [Candidatus Dadabacteria bacterium]|nr:hypothetical protein [Candidatus Dadabacteria bacterium]